MFHIFKKFLYGLWYYTGKEITTYSFFEQLLQIWKPEPWNLKTRARALKFKNSGSGQARDSKNTVVFDWFWIEKYLRAISEHIHRSILDRLKLFHGPKQYFNIKFHIFQGWRLFFKTSKKPFKRTEKASRCIPIASLRSEKYSTYFENYHRGRRSL